MALVSALSLPVAPLSLRYLESAWLSALGTGILLPSARRSYSCGYLDLGLPTLTIPSVPLSLAPWPGSCARPSFCPALHCLRLLVPLDHSTSRS
ncbi:hypothetical protein LMH87_007474 [Akanthomyces muscarius]|uniref:Uncharacterized protein n=1 Tax=Akanthomyces muscarius TaxID=2231603 RepID=A0A9W8UU77_AKAMU|nr:hypothetical protein LMH87_007474 [Akanthomyces muscarius]KAJ4165864.1 hypothetical protein LMH87_007474 [Akanthomyces muscarius]